jgi:hypothetical protein
MTGVEMSRPGPFGITLDFSPVEKSYGLPVGRCFHLSAAAVLAGPADEVHDQVAGLLGAPEAVRVPGHLENMDPPGRYLHDEQHVQA